MRKIRVLWDFLVWYIFWGVGCAAPIRVGPFVPDPPHYCAADPDCKDGEECSFTGVDTRPVCVPSPDPR